MGWSAGTSGGLVNVVHYAVHGTGLTLRDRGHGGLRCCGGGLRGRLRGGHGGHFCGLGANIPPAPAEDHATERQTYRKNGKLLHLFPS